MSSGETAPGTYSASLEKARAEFRARPMAGVAALAGAVFNEAANAIDTVYIGRPYRVDSGGGVAPFGHGAALSELETATILHNLLVATGREPVGRLVTYREFVKVGRAGGASMKDSDMLEFAKYFSAHPEKLHGILDVFPGERESHGDVSISVRLLPKIPVIFAVWHGEDDLIPPEAVALFDAAASDYLPLEDLGAIPAFAMSKFLSEAKRLV